MHCSFPVRSSGPSFHLTCPAVCGKLGSAESIAKTLWFLIGFSSWEVPREVEKIEEKDKCFFPSPLLDHIWQLATFLYL